MLFKAKERDPAHRSLPSKHQGVTQGSVRKTARLEVLVVLVVAGVVRASPVGELQAEHRELPQDILSGLPVASQDTFSWSKPDGSYRFGMQGDDQWRVESRDADGTVRGRYVYKTPEGRVVDVSYDSGTQGYRARGDAVPGGEAPLTQAQHKDDSMGQDLGSLRQDQQQQEITTTDDFSKPYGALLLREVEKTRPSGNGVFTFSDDNTLAIITDIRENKTPRKPAAVFPLVFIPGSSEQLFGPPTLDGQPVLPGAIPV